MPSTIQKYGAHWPDTFDALKIEFGCIKRNGKWKGSSGQECGLGLFEHYRNAMRLCWPRHDENRWADLLLREFLSNKITAVLGPASSAKTFNAARFALIDYWSFPDITCILVSSTDVRGLELRVWGKMKELWQEGVDRFDWLAGTPIDYLHAIATDNISDGDKIRVLNKGIVCIPCLASGKYIGLGKYVGIKQKRVRLIADECQLMGHSFLDAISNLGANPDFKAGLLGNPIDPMDPLGMAAEPYDGWTAMPEPEKTKVWTTRFPGGMAVNLVGTDSPNNDFPGDKPKFPYLIHKKRIEEVEAFWGKDSLQYFSQAVGVMKSGLLTWRVITMDLCRTHQAFEKAIWASEERTRIYAIDVAYGGVGGDRCVAGWGEFGQDQDGQQILRVNPPVIVPVSIAKNEIPEDQIADFVKDDASANFVPVENIFYDSTGRGTMGSAFARRFGSITPNPVEFGGRPTRRPVRLDLFINDESRHGEQRHKRCDEHYYDFVTELWFTSRYAIETNQIRELPEDVAREGCQRKYEPTKGNKLAVESKHDPKARERMKESPDKYDWFVTLIEGARRKGFQIQRLGVEFVDNGDDEWQDDREEFQEITESLMLIH